MNLRKIWNDRSTIITEFLRWTFGIAITFIYMSMILTLCGIIMVIAQMVDTSGEFTISLFFFFSGSALFAFGCALLAWMYLITYYQYVFGKVSKYLIKRVTANSYDMNGYDDNYNDGPDHPRPPL